MNLNAGIKQMTVGAAVDSGIGIDTLSAKLFISIVTDDGKDLRLTNHDHLTIVEAQHDKCFVEHVETDGAVHKIEELVFGKKYSLCLTKDVIEALCHFLGIEKIEESKELWKHFEVDGEPQTIAFKNPDTAEIASVFIDRGYDYKEVHITKKII